MAIFTAIATFVVTSITGAAIVAGSWAAFAVSVIAAGLAAGTSRLIMGTRRGSGQSGSDKGVRVTLPPATDNKIPVIYGSVWQQGVVTDARLSNENKTMTYVLVLSEKTSTGDFSIGDILWSESKLVFKEDGFTVGSTIDPDGTADGKLDGLVRIRVYSGDTPNQIFPAFPLPQVDAKTMIGETDALYRLFNTVFAVIQIDYNAEKDVTGLPIIKFQVNNTLKNPGSVWYDYMTNNRYGAGFSFLEVDSLNSISTTNPESLFSWSNNTTGLIQFDTKASFSGSISGNTLTVTDVYSGSLAVGQRVMGATSLGSADTITGLGPDTNGGPGTYTLNVSRTVPASKLYTDVPLTQARYEINAVINTSDTILNNVEKINLASSSWTTFDYAQGVWKIIVNKAATQTTLNNSLLYDDNNIIGEVTVTSTPIEDQFNSFEVEFPDRKLKDQYNYFRESLDPVQMALGEPNNKMRLRLEYVNNNVHATRIARIEMKQTRADIVITFLADYTGIQSQVGDIIRVTNPVYGFENDYFRVTRVREIEGEDGGLYAEISGIEYNADVYTEEPLTGFVDPPLSDIPLFGGSTALPKPGTPLLLSSISSAAVPEFILRVTIPASSYPIDTVEVFQSIDTVTYTYLAQARPAGIAYSPGDQVDLLITGLPSGTYYFKARLGSRGLRGNLSDVPLQFVWGPNPLGTIIGQNFEASFQPGVMGVAVDPLGAPDFTDVAPRLYGQSGGAVIDFVTAQTDSDVSFVNNSFRIGGSSTTGNGSIVLTNITINTTPTDGGGYAQFATPTAMSAEPAFIEVPVRYKNNVGEVYQGIPARLQLNFVTAGAQGPAGPTGPLGPVGPEGPSGVTGSDGSTPRRVYQRYSPTLGQPALPSPSTGFGTIPPGWSGTDPTPGSNDVLWVADGVYNPTTNITTWTVVYAASVFFTNLQSDNYGATTGWQISRDTGNAVFNQISITGIIDRLSGQSLLSSNAVRTDVIQPNAVTDSSASSVTMPNFNTLTFNISIPPGTFLFLMWADGGIYNAIFTPIDIFSPPYTEDLYTPYRITLNGVGIIPQIPSGQPFTQGAGHFASIGPPAGTYTVQIITDPVAPPSGASPVAYPRISWMSLKR